MFSLTRQSIRFLFVAVFSIGISASAYADLYIHTWSAIEVFDVGVSAKHDGRVYKCIAVDPITSKTMEPVAGGNAHWQELDAWAAGEAYTEGNLVYFGAGPDVYLAVQDHNSAAANDPTHATHWRKPFPKDNPVSVNGEGPAGNDWVDFNAQPAANLFWDDNGTSQTATALGLVIETDNPNYDLAKNRNDNGDEVRHFCYEDDYGRAGGPTVADGNTDWDNWYAGYTPAIVNTANATNKTNCVSKAFDAYKGQAKSSNWVNSGADAAPYITGDNLNQVAAHGNNGDVNTNAGDRCHNDEHVWYILEASTATEQCAARKIQWKNNSSRIHTWSPNPDSNDGPKGNGGGSYGDYAIHRK